MLGDDLIDGGQGIDTASYENAGEAVQVYLNFGFSLGADGRDTVSNIETLHGSALDDRLIGDGNDNTFQGGGGNDIVKGKGGADTFFGGAGKDTLHGDADVDTMHEVPMATFCWASQAMIS